MRSEKERWLGNNEDVNEQTRIIVRGGKEKRNGN